MGGLGVFEARLALENTQDRTRYPVTLNMILLFLSAHQSADG
jgi:hypothetical protein